MSCGKPKSRSLYSVISMAEVAKKARNNRKVLKKNLVVVKVTKLTLLKLNDPETGKKRTGGDAREAPADEARGVGRGASQGERRNGLRSRTKLKRSFRLRRILGSSKSFGLRKRRKGHLHLTFCGARTSGIRSRRKILRLN